MLSADGFGGGVFMLTVLTEMNKFSGQNFDTRITSASIEATSVDPSISEGDLTLPVFP